MTSTCEWIGPLRATINSVEAASRQLSEDRASFLDQAAALICEKLGTVERLGLNFICTHNSRRSHLSQIWAALAVHAFELSKIDCFSGGTEATACNPRIIASLRRAGFSVVNPEPQSQNPHYLLQFSDRATPVELFSKTYADPANGNDPFIAMMCCDHADENCPVIQGSIGRVPLHYRDPKESDDSPHESQTYDERRDQIGAEMFYLIRAASGARG